MSKDQPDDVDTIYATDEERQKAIRYSRTREWLFLLSSVLDALATVATLSTGLSARMRDWAAKLAPKRLGPVMPYTVISSLLSFVGSLPFSYYSGYTVEHRYGLSNQMRRAWLLEHLKGLGVGLVLGLPLMQGAYEIVRRYPRRWWAILSGLTIPFSILLGNLAPVLLLPLFNKFQPVRDRSLAKRLEDLAEKEGVHVSQVLEMDMSKQTKKVNAFFTGIGNTKRIVLGDTLLEEFTPDEVEVVLAHELGHQVHRDLWKLIGMGALASLGTFYAVHRLADAIIPRYGGRWGLQPERGIEDVASMPLLGLLMGGVGLALAPALNGLTRAWVEHRADRYALDLTGKRDAFISSMQKLGRLNLADPDPPAVIKYLLHNHPTIKERIEFGRGYTNGK